MTQKMVLLSGSDPVQALTGSNCTCCSDCPDPASAHVVQVSSKAHADVYNETARAANTSVSSDSRVSCLTLKSRLWIFNGYRKAPVRCSGLGPLDAGPTEDSSAPVLLFLRTDERLRSGSGRKASGCMRIDPRWTTRCRGPVFASYTRDSAGPDDAAPGPDDADALRWRSSRINSSRVCADLLAGLAMAARMRLLRSFPRICCSYLFGLLSGTRRCADHGESAARMRRSTAQPLLVFYTNHLGLCFHHETQKTYKWLET